LQLGAVTRVAADKAVPAVRASVGKVIAETVPAIQGSTHEQELAGLNARERNAVADIAAWVAELEREDAEVAAAAARKRAAAAGGAAGGSAPLA
jgi:hypothetical protein